MDGKDLDRAIYNYGRISQTIQTLQITATRSNLNAALGCIQLCDREIDALNAEKEEKEEKEEKRSKVTAFPSTQDVKEVKGGTINGR